MCSSGLSSYAPKGRRGLHLFPFLLFFFLVGCVATTKDMESLDARLTVVSDRLGSIEKRLDSMEERLTLLEEREKRVEVSFKAFRTRLADTEVSLDDLKSDLRYLRDGVERSDKALSDLGDRVIQLETRLATLEKGVKIIEAKEKKKPVDPQKSYDTALQLFRAGQYLDSMEAFKKFLREFPEHRLAGNAQYWIGECLLAMGKKKEAILSFDKVVKGYPNSPKIPSALLKEGLTFLSLGDKAVARILLKRVVEEYPDTDQAKIAAKKLRTLAAGKPRTSKKKVKGKH